MHASNCTGKQDSVKCVRQCPQASHVQWRVGKVYACQSTVVHNLLSMDYHSKGVCRVKKKMQALSVQFIAGYFKLWLLLCSCPAAKAYAAHAQPYLDVTWFKCLDLL